MRKSCLKKGLVVGIIILFLGTGVLPSISGNLVNVTTSDSYLNNSTTGYQYILIGFIKNVHKIPRTEYGFDALIVYYVWLYQGDVIDSGFLTGNQRTIVYSTFKIGIVTNHIVCGIFFV